ncbi:Hypothetical protein PHPALM_415 [Phytophthora palmivora]|uniref:Uncharacterized protein n=1 Tax=Phytophthora palmivora TaxID=4796 RepID=A0A2P4YUY7_9STRA|nr:Hypothetical protein PHPALM_415 [Phytophthora palmivora]
MKSNYSALPPWGYHVSKLYLPSHVIAELLSEAAARQYVPVFKEVEYGDEDHDRKLSRLPLQASKCSTKSFLPCAHARSELRANRVLEQKPHQNYTPAAIAKVTNKHPGTIPCSMIVALEEGTKLKVFDGCY